MVRSIGSVGKFLLREFNQFLILYNYPVYVFNFIG